MSSTSTSALISAYAAGLVDNRCAVAVQTFFIYECILELPREVELFWKRPWTGATVLFIANKYLFLLHQVLSAIALRTTFSADSVLLSEFSALRAFALSQSRLIALGIFILSLTPLGFNAPNLAFGFVGTTDPLLGCAYSQPTLPSNLPFKCKHFVVTSVVLKARADVGYGVGLITVRTSLIFADAFLVGLTWYRLRRSIGHSRGRFSLSTVFLRDGSIYFIILCILNVLHMTLSLTATFSDRAGDVGLSAVPLFTEPITAVLISRFLLNLQEANLRATLDRSGFLTSTSAGSDSEGTSTAYASATDRDSTVFTSAPRIYGTYVGTGSARLGTNLTFASFADAVGGALEPEDVWGGGGGERGWYGDEEEEKAKGEGRRGAREEIELRPAEREGRESPR
ncbi:uncharacterized protein BXZ73DRAFT_104874 [Epithele typhae]|uniref:uncharacterized protein n=1 Tax=Epithele typhae TaxID=378194 RepID=UPI0020071F33|nr:uncharacterized protein BXZ73DRAFT_104874 [Epithele typhae]KAH9919766.1 hypothetical protein BXZ73DRAFT_104874 [Epithele typhae]